MLNNKKYESKNKHGMLAQQVEISEAQEVSEESLNGAIQILKKQAKQYNNAGLTQISNWL
jgi:hypothetical protein